MNKIKIWFLVILMIFSVYGQAMANTLHPITPICVYRASQYYKVPLAALIGIMAVEAGQIGKFSTNKDGTRDNGPMQINTVWMPEFGKKGITESQLRNDGCLNVFAAAWILNQHFQSTENKWDAVGRYHSKTPKFNLRYQKMVQKKLASINNYTAIIQKANGSN